jgi:tetrahydromethanopterin S-methyltransferase subunit H
MPQEYFSYGDIKLGYGGYDLPPIMIGTMFYQSQTLVDRKNEENFDEEKAVKRINAQKDLAKKY